MYLAIDTQYMENYGAHAWDGKGECPQYWKYKGGETYVIPLPGDFKFSFDALRALVNKAKPKIEYSHDYGQEYVIGWEVIENTSKFEHWERPKRLSYREVAAF